jgi:hypothetical protein
VKSNEIMVNIEHKKHHKLGGFSVDKFFSQGYYICVIFGAKGALHD